MLAASFFAQTVSIQTRPMPPRFPRPVVNSFVSTNASTFQVCVKDVARQGSRIAAASAGQPRAR